PAHVPVAGLGGEPDSPSAGSKNQTKHLGRKKTMGKGTLRKRLRTFGVAPQATFMFSTPSRAVPVLVALMLGGGALIGATVAAADTAFTTTPPFPFPGTNYC